jgi:hypothetical protein
MNVTGNDLAGDTASIGAILTANLFTQALMSAEVLTGETAKFNLSQRSTLNETVDGSAVATINMAGPGDTVTNSGPAYGSTIVNMSVGDTATVGAVDGGKTTVNMVGGDTVTAGAGYGGVTTVNMSGNNNLTVGADRASATVNLAPGAVLNGTLDGTYAGHIVLQGGSGSLFNNNGNSEADIPGGSLEVNADVIGKGLFTVNGGSMSFLKSVGPNQSVTLEYGGVSIANPNQFKGTLTLTGGFGQVSLGDIVKADSYSFTNDILDIWSSNKVVASLKMINQDTLGFAVGPPTGGSLTITALSPGVTTTFPSLPVHNWT